MNKIPQRSVAARSTEARIAASVQAWQRLQSSPEHPHEVYPFITISREVGCEALPLAHHLAEILNERCRPTLPWVAYDRELLDRVASELHLARDIVESLDGTRRGEMAEFFDSILNRKLDEALVFRKLAEVIRSLAMHGHVILVGRGSYMITQDLKNGLHIRLVGPRDWRVHNMETQRGLSRQAAEEFVSRRERERLHFLNTYFAHDPAHPFQHDLTMSAPSFNVAQLSEIIFAALGSRFGETLVGA